MDIKAFKELPKSTENDQRNITKMFLDEFYQEPSFVALRTFVEENAYGFGEKQFYPFHKMIVDAIESDNLTFLEIGVFRGQTLVLYALLRHLSNKKIDVYGITPLDSSGGHWESDYEADIRRLHEMYIEPQPNIIKGLSTSNDVIEKCKDMCVDILYIDGDHSYKSVMSDLKNYSGLVKPGGYLVCDDSANNIPGAYWGEFWGVQETSDAVDDFLPPATNNNDWEYIGNVIHNRVWRRM